MNFYSGFEGLILTKALARDVELREHAIPTVKDLRIFLECRAIVTG